MDRNYTLLFGMAVETLPRPLEKMVTSMKFNEVVIIGSLYLFIFGANSENL